MLTHIHIRDFAIVEELELALSTGMTALTGETGAGKSILVDALGLLLGDRAEASWVRHGTEKAEISGDFTLESLPAAQQWLAEQELTNEDGECQMRRVISREGRSRAFINGRPVPLQSLRGLGSLLVDIHGQHEHQSLIQRDIQRTLLDGYGGHEALLEHVAAAYRKWHSAREERERLRSLSAERDSRLEFVRFQVEEMATLALREGELDTLEEDHARLANTDHLLESCSSSLLQLFEAEDSSAHHLISHALVQVAALTQLDPSLKPVWDLLNDAQIQVQEAADTLRRYTDRLEQDPQQLQQVEQRLGVLHDLARKHRVEAAALPALYQQLEQELADLDDADQRLEQLDLALAQQAGHYRTTAAALHMARQQAAQGFSRKITAAMQQLGMPGGIFQVQVTRREDEKFSGHGSDHIEFLVSANPGQPPMALGKVASGGELSRISLAIQVIAADSAQIPTLIFDEVDTGVGGGIAETVGTQLRTLGSQRQVLCVTHLPQVAAQAHHHLQVAKLAGDNTTRTSIRNLGNEERVDEIARMLGGIKITASTRQHAEEMIAAVSVAKPRKKGNRKGN